MKLNARQFENGLLADLSDQINQTLPFHAENIRKRFSKELYDAILYSPEVSSLLGGVLRGEFGFEQGAEESYVEPMVDFASSRVGVSFSPVNLRAGATELIMEVVYFDFNVYELLEVQNASYMSKGGPVNWLEWLTLAGDSIRVVETHSIIYGFNKKIARSRSGLAIMRKSGNGYRVPPAYSGTEDDNFLIRAALTIPAERIIEEQFN